MSKNAVGAARSLRTRPMSGPYREIPYLVAEVGSQQQPNEDELPPGRPLAKVNRNCVVNSGTAMSSIAEQASAEK